MVVIGGKRVGEIVGRIGGNGVGQILVAVAAALFVRLFSGPGPALLPENDFDDDDKNDDSDDFTVDGKVFPVTIRWSNLSCSLSDKKSNSVNLTELSLFFWSIYSLVALNYYYYACYFILCLLLNVKP